MSAKLSSTLEDYLQTIYRLERRDRVARPRDIADEQGVARSTVTSALQSLSERGFIDYEPYELITLTQAGRERADRLMTRHRIVREFLEQVLRLDPERAEATACNMEHAVDPEALGRFVCFLTFIKREERAGADWLGEMQRFMKERAETRSCQECVREYERIAKEDEEEGANR